MWMHGTDCDAHVVAARMNDVAPTVTPAVAWVRWFVPPLALVLALDQATKVWLFPADPQAQSAVPALPGWIVLSHNSGVAWGMGNSMPMVVVVVTALLIPLLGWVWWKHFRQIGRVENLAFGAVLGGALGNGIDRAQMAAGSLAGVRDFIHVNLGFWPLNPWPTFNIADAGITGGFLVLAALSLAKPKPGPTPGMRIVV